MAVLKKKRRARPATEVVPPKRLKPTEPDAIQKARARVRKLVSETTEGKSKLGVSIVLALVNQETGSHKAANAIIDEFSLDKRFGLQKFEFSDAKEGVKPSQHK